MHLYRTPAVAAGLSLAVALFPVTGASGAVDPPGKGLRGGPCYRTSCDGLDPKVTGCTKNAFIASDNGRLVRVAAFDGYVELRYGPGEMINGRRTCMVNWARFVKSGQGAGYNVWVEREGNTEDKKLTQYSGGDEGTGIIYSDQVFAPDGLIRARACVETAKNHGAGTSGPGAGGGGAAGRTIGRLAGICTQYL
ncbi:DUF2690 domain-containing protein [Nonomuraea sp. NPDC049784]|uniref:DUF2690 domain-containing protein n=1 Tax=Nonomuraea sp. NPDC049784 TaxID=3154361 RepID=UPI0033CC3835